jgi:hypothetical protein
MATHAKMWAICLCGAVLGNSLGVAHSAEVVQLDKAHWREYAPHGKEVDAIFGDYVLRNDKLIAVVAQAVPTRNANMTVRNVGGAIIDLTQRARPNDQLSAFYPHGSVAELRGPIDWSEAFGDQESAADAADNDAEAPARLAFRLSPPDRPRSDGLVPPEVVVGYELEDGAEYIVVISKITNSNAVPLPIRLRDGIRADGEFQFGFDEGLDLWWAADEFWGQAYGVQPVGKEFRAVGDDAGRARDPRTVRYQRADGSRLEVPAKSSLTLRRRVFPAQNTFDIREIAGQSRGGKTYPLSLTVSDPHGPVKRASVEFTETKGDKFYAEGRTDETGHLFASLPTGEYEVRVLPPGRSEAKSRAVIEARQNELEVALPQPGYVAAKIVDDAGRPLACKVSFAAQDQGTDPNFGPDSAVRGVRNLRYTPNGRFRVALDPGRYQVVISHGPEFDAILKTIEVEPGNTYRLEETLAHSVDTTGWLSADFHSHSSPSGDNTASQRGRVLNLLAEHIEFAPCTEHNRISTYVSHLKALDAVDRMATCCGMELTGRPLPLNHQNAFPLIRHPHTQDGGAPVTDVNPVVQIERLAMWDEGSDKLVQINHPNIIQMLGDRDQNGQPDEGFERMFLFMDVMEVHPPGSIFDGQDALYRSGDEFGNRMFNWLQLLNLGYRVPGVVNTDAHWNFHGSGWLRNYIRSTTDDPAEASVQELVRESELGHIVMTNGPFLEVEARAADAPEQTAIPGDDLVARGGAVNLHVRVQCPNWLEVNRVQVFVNGRPEEKLNYTRRKDGAMFAGGPVVFDQSRPISLSADAHLVVAVAGEDRQLGVVYGLTQGAESPQGAAMPVAVANPIFVDVDGDGFEPNGDMLGLPLPVRANHHPSHGHDHENFHKHRHSHDGTAGEPGENS